MILTSFDGARVGFTPVGIGDDPAAYLGHDGGPSSFWSRERVVPGAGECCSQPLGDVRDWLGGS